MSVTVIFALTLSLLFTACKGSNTTQAGPPAMPPPLVKAAQPTRQDITEWDEYTGRIEATETVAVKSRVNGYLVQVNFKAGDKVKKGDLLFVIDPRPYQAEAARTESELKRAETRLELTRSELKRAVPLLKARALSQEEYEARDAAAREADAAVKTAAAAVQLAHLNLQFTEIRSPISGRISRELITVGNLVRSDDTLLTVIVSTDPVYVYLDADERAILKYRRMAESGLKGSGRVRPVPAELALIDETGYPHQGHIDYSEPRLDAATGSLKIRGIFSNAADLLSPGFFARVRISSGKPHSAILVPDRAVATDQDQRYVWILKDNDAVEYRRIVPGGKVGGIASCRKDSARRIG